MGDALIPPSTAPEGAINIVEDGGVQKMIVAEGTGEVPPLHSRCLVHYVGRLAATGEVFMDTRKESTMSEPAKLVAGRDSLLRESGIHLAVAKMRVGERSHIWITPAYGYGSSGNFSFPTIPPEAHLTYDLELLDFEPPVDGKHQRDMTYEERLEAAERRRGEGNEAFKLGQYKEALGKYSASLAFIDDDLLMQLHGFHYDKAMEARQPALLNMSACHLKLGDNNAAITAASQVLGNDPHNAKALFRRGSARLALGQTQAAVEDLQAARKAAPKDAGIARELAAALEAIRDERKAEKEMFSGLLERSGGAAEKEIGVGQSSGSSSSREREAAVMAQASAPASGLAGWLWGLVDSLYFYLFGKKKVHTE